MADHADCRTCIHNYYRNASKETSEAWFACSHPLTLERGPKWQPGDPAMVSYRTGDVRMKDIVGFANCPTYEAASLKERV
jgi:hypothetical protein